MSNRINKIKTIFSKIHNIFWLIVSKIGSILNVMRWFRPLFLVLSKRGDSVGRYAFLCLMLITYGRKAVKWAEYQHDKIDRSAARIDSKLRREGYRLKSSAKAKAFDRAAEAEIAKDLKSRKEVEQMIPKLREDIVKFKNWFDKDKIEIQKVRIELEGGEPVHYSQMVDHDEIKKAYLEEVKEAALEEAELEPVGEKKNGRGFFKRTIGRLGWHKR